MRPGNAVRLLVAVASFAVAASCSATEEAANPRFEPATDGALTVAAALPSPGFWDGDDPATVDGGFEWAIARALADRFDLELRVVDVPFERIAVGDLGGADLALAQIELTAERERAVDFSVTYYDTADGVLARAGADAIDDVATAKERSWVALEGSQQGELLRDVVDPDGGITTVPLEVDAVEAVVDGDVDAALVDLPSALILAGTDPRLTVLSKFEGGGRYAAALPDGSPNLEVVDAALRRMASDGTLRDLASTWLDPFFSVPPDDVPVIVARD